MITDHGFRVLDDDPMYGRAHGWRRQHYLQDPAPIANAKIRHCNLQPIIFQKRGLTADADNSIHNGAEASAGADDPAVVCHDDLKARDGADSGLNHDELLFIIYDEQGEDYDDDVGSRVSIVVDEDGNLVDMYMAEGDDGPWAACAAPASSPTVTAELITITATTAAAAAAVPGSEESIPTFPVSTMVTTTRQGSVVSLPPF
ncbi:hypothetical protein VTI74DRAFT_6332 [Chaetomium olivicolor]